MIQYHVTHIEKSSLKSGGLAKNTIISMVFNPTFLA